VSVKIRLMRMGKKKQPTYRVVIADGRSPRDGRYIEIVGQYRPREEPSHFAVDDEKVLGWLRQGAQPTDQVHRLLVNAGIWERYETDRKAESRAVRTAAARAKGAAVRQADADAAAKATADAEAKAAAETAAAEAAAAKEAEAAAAAAAEAAPEEAATDEASE
jgi:small subunit ribosomal protein S16